MDKVCWWDIYFSLAIKKMNPLQNRQGAPGYINSLYSDLRTNITILRSRQGVRPEPQAEKQGQRPVGGVRRSTNGTATQFKVPVVPVPVPVAPPVPSRALVLLEEKMGIMEGLIGEQVRELGRLRDELEISSIGTLKIQISEDANVYEERTASTNAPVEVLPAGTILKVSYPFEENEEGIWASKQVVELTSNGLMLTGRYFLLASRTSPDSFSPCVSIISK